MRALFRFNKTRDDFDSDRAYNDYLEMVEDISELQSLSIANMRKRTLLMSRSTRRLAFNLINDIDRADTERRITEYTTANASQILSNASRAKEESNRQRAADAEIKRTREENAQKAREEEALGEAEREGLKARAWEEIAKGGSGEGAYERLKRLKAGVIPPVAVTKTLPLPSALLGNENTSPLSPSYAGPYVPFPFSQPPETLSINKGFHDPPTYEAQRRAHGTDTGRVRAGGWIVDELWERDRRLAAESLWVV
ncbi:hypothetical protein QFC19_000164 [Naganishia cerealis]|uniref:Uncharacterized protein n=1 Tax=Naganishia cerealis TaxID=610337 RepID=A0ACC2WR68_9TREE|nr:hypothetical protein QFC19_000164 [Naganishia cerealis]